MRRYLLAATVLATIATPAAATRDGSGYVGVEGGVLFPNSQDLFASVTFTDPTISPFARTQVARIKYKAGYDVDLIGGYDFGMFRIEGELGYKRARQKSLTLTNQFVTVLNGNAGTTFTTADRFNLSNHTSVWSAMVNGLVDFGGTGSGFGGYAGGGVGYGDVKQFGGSKGKFAWQLLAGVYMPVSDQIDVGLKYRYFRAGHSHRTVAFPFTAGAGPCGPAAAPVACSGGTVFFDNSGRFSSHSLLLSLVYSFAAPAPPPPPATQTCPDGSVIPATSTCPAPPPPPPPPPAPAPERGQ